MSSAAAVHRAEQNARRSLARRRDQGDIEREQNRLDALFDLELACVCGHELGFHRFTTPALPTPCGFYGCACQEFERKEPSMLNAHDPFAGLGEPEEPPPTELTAAQFVEGLSGEPPEPEPEPEPDEPDSVEPMTAVADVAAAFGASFSAPVGTAIADDALTPVRFPVLASGVDSVPLLDLQAPAQRVAEIVEALQPVLAPPPVVRDLVELVATANALQVTDATSYARGCELYEELAANEKGIEETISPVVAFFHRPWKALCDFRAQFAKPVAEAKKRLSDDCGAWKLAEDKRAKAAADRQAEETAAAERARLREIAEAATAAAASAPPASPVRELLEQTAAQATEEAQHVAPIPHLVRSSAPATPTRGRKSWEAVVTDEDAFYEALVKDKTRRVAAPIDQAYLNRQAGDLGEDLSQRFPGVEAREKGGLSAKGRRS